MLGGDVFVRMTVEFFAIFRHRTEYTSAVALSG